MKVKVRAKKRIEGTVNIKGAKNSAVAIIPAAIMCEDEVILHNIPNISDVNILLDILNDLGYYTSFNDNTLVMKPVKKPKKKITSPKVSKMRGSYYFLGAFLGKYKKITMNSSGGCNLGLRPINYHLNGFKQLGAKYRLKNGVLEIKSRKLKAATINLEFPSVGATINIMIASVFASGTTIINNAAKEPEVIDTANFLNAMGAKIEHAGTNCIKITGVKKLHKTEYTIFPDRIEAGTYLFLGALSNGNGVTLNNVCYDHLISVIDVLKQIGLKIITFENKIYIKKDGSLKPVNITTGPYPLFPTDLGPMLTVLLTQIEGTSSLTETIFTKRFSQVEDLIKMGAKIDVQNNVIYVTGKTKLEKSDVTCHDLRGAASLILASTVCKGYSIIDNIDVLFRGYEDPFSTLKNIGMEIKEQ